MELLTDQEYKLLKLLYRKKRTIDFLLKRLHISDAKLQELVNGTLTPYIFCCTNYENWKQGTVEAISTGRALWEEKRRGDNRYRVSVLLSTCAIAIALAAFVKSFFF